MYRVDFFNVGPSSARWSTTRVELPSDDDLLASVRARGCMVDAVVRSSVGQVAGEFRHGRNRVGTFSVVSLDGARRSGGAVDRADTRADLLRREDVAERAAILEYDAKMSREDAERLAVEMWERRNG